MSPRSEQTEMRIPAEAPPGEQSLTPIIMFGGVLTLKQLLPAYALLLRSDKRTNPPSRERFMPIPKGSLGHPADMQEQFESFLVRAYERIGQPLVVGGHSLGGLAATKVALSHPDKVASVVCLAGAQDGVKHKTPSARALELYIGRRDITELIYHDSDYIQQHRQSMAANWPAEVPLHLLSATADDIIWDHGLSVELPAGQMPVRRIVAPGWAERLGIMQRMNPSRPADTVRLASDRPTGHVDLPLAGAVIRYVQELRGQSIGHEESGGPQLDVA